MALKRMKEFSVKGNDTLFECPNTMDGHFYKLVFDCSSSMETHEDTMRTCLKNYKQQISVSIKYFVLNQYISPLQIFLLL